MRKMMVKVEDLINDDSIGFGDSDGVVRDAFSQGKIGEWDKKNYFHNVQSKYTKAFTLDWKLEECEDAFLDSVGALGIRNPVALFDGMIMDGYHRMAAARHLGVEIPLIEYDSWEEFDENHKWEKAGLVNSDGFEAMG